MKQEEIYSRTNDSFLLRNITEPFFINKVKSKEHRYFGILNNKENKFCFNRYCYKDIYNRVCLPMHRVSDNGRLKTFVSI